MRLISTKLALGAAAMAAAVFFTPVATGMGVASAATIGPQPGLTVDSSAVTPVKHWHRGRWVLYGIAGGLALGAAGAASYCSAQADRCAEYYGAYSYRYERCMRRAGC